MKRSTKKPSVLLAKKHYKQELRASCVAAAARMLLDYHDIANVPEAELRRILKTKPDGTNVLNLLFLKDEKRWGLEVEIARANPDELFAAIRLHRIPVIAFVDTTPLPHWNESTAHVVLVVGYNEEPVIINDPFFEKRRNQDSSRTIL